MNKLLTSRRLWTFLATQVFSIITFVVANKVADPFALQLGTLLISTAQGLGGILIVAFTVDDTASNITAIKAGTHPDYPSARSEPPK